MSVNEANPTELDSLRQRITELEAELDKKNVEIFDLNNENQKLRKELESRIEELEKDRADTDAENIKRDAENAELKVRVAKLEQDSSVVDEQSQDAEDGKVFLLRGRFAGPEATKSGAFSKKGTSGDQSNNANTKLTEDDPVNAFLIEQHKKSIGGEKKLALQGELQRESTVQETPSVSRERKNGQGLIQEISSAKENHVTDISETARSRKTDAIDLPEAPKAGAITPGASMIEISQILAQLCDKALTAEECTLEANQEEILCWYHYGRNFVFQEKALCDKNKIGEKKAKGLIYDEVVRQLNILRKKRSQDTGSPLPDISRDSLRKKTQRAVKIYKLFEKVGIDKVKHIRSYSANEISKFTNDEIQTIIDHFTEKPNIDFTDDPEGTPAEERTDEMVRAEAVNTDEVIGVTSEVNVSTTPIPSTHDPGTGPGNSSTPQI